MSTIFNIELLRQRGVNDAYILRKAHQINSSLKKKENFNLKLNLYKEIAWSIRNNDPVVYSLLHFVRGVKDDPGTLEGSPENELMDVYGAKYEILKLFFKTVKMSRLRLEKLVMKYAFSKDYKSVSLISSILSHKKLSKEKQKELRDENKLQQFRSAGLWMMVKLFKKYKEGLIMPQGTTDEV